MSISNKVVFVAVVSWLTAAGDLVYADVKKRPTEAAPQSRRILSVQFEAGEAESVLFDEDQLDGQPVHILRYLQGDSKIVEEPIPAGRFHELTGIFNAVFTAALLQELKTVLPCGQSLRVKKLATPADGVRICLDRTPKDKRAFVLKWWKEVRKTAGI